ncbi:MAG TPA: hypothetical protein VFW87_25910 [Pirellulales bacterium]|nr:hypothetical protein [Pirellulales bacterium]
MSATKEIKDLLQQARQELDDESRTRIEPILRLILEHAKPKTVTQVEYRSDPLDKAALETLRKEIDAKDNAIRTLQFKLTSAQLRQGMSLDELREAATRRGKEFFKCLARCMDFARAETHEDRKRQLKTEIMNRSVIWWHVFLATYLEKFESGSRIVGADKLNKIIGQSNIDALHKLSQAIHSESGVKIDFNLDTFRRLT